MRVWYYWHLIFYLPVQDHNTGLASSVQCGECFGRLVVAPQVTLGLTWAVPHIEPDTVFMVWKLDKEFINILSVHAGFVGRRSEDSKTDYWLVKVPAGWKHHNSCKDFTISDSSVYSSVIKYVGTYCVHCMFWQLSLTMLNQLEKTIPVLSACFSSLHLTFLLAVFTSYKKGFFLDQCVLLQETFDFY